MPNSKTNNDVSSELSQALHETTSLTQTLLNEIQDNATSLATLQIKLENLGESVKSLSDIIKDGNGKGSMITRMAVIDKDIQNVQENLRYYIDSNRSLKKDLYGKIEEIRKQFIDNEKSDAEYKREKRLNFLKLIGVSSPGFLALLLKLIQILGN